MSEPAAPLYTLKVTLEGLTPPIWRRLELPGDTHLELLHLYVQAVFGWENKHLFQFEHANKIYGPRGEDAPADEIDARTVTLASIASRGAKLTYVYDFGDEWRHTIEIEKVTPQAIEPEAHCLDGERAAPPEDSGGPPGYEEKLEALKNPKSARGREVAEWMPEDFDPEDFSLEEADALVELIWKSSRRAGEVEITEGPLDKDAVYLSLFGPIPVDEAEAEDIPPIEVLSAFDSNGPIPPETETSSLTIDEVKARNKGKRFLCDESIPGRIREQYGLTVAPMPRDLAMANAAMVWALAGVPVPDELELVFDFLEAAAALLKHGPWTLVEPSDKISATVIKKGKPKHYDLALVASPDALPLLHILSEPTAHKLLLEALEGTRDAEDIPGLWLQFDEVPLWATRILKAAFGMDAVPLLLRMKNREPQPPSAADFQLSILLCRALAQLSSTKSSVSLTQDIHGEELSATVALKS